MHPSDKPSCFTSHMGHWVMEPHVLKSTVASIKAGMLDGMDDFDPEIRYKVSDGVAIIGIDGMMMKGQSKFGGTSTVYTRRFLRDALANDEVKEILLVVESGGGTVAGTKELADDIKNASKPVTAYITDIGASAAYWVASQSGAIYANEMAEIGSIGVVAVVEDTSEAYERAGVKVHVVSTGDMKGAFTDGAPISEEMLADMQSKVDNINTVFKASILGARSMSADTLDTIADGRTYTARQALEYGLIDGIFTFEDVLSNIKSRIILAERNRRATSRLSQSAKR